MIIKNSVIDLKNNLNNKLSTQIRCNLNNSNININNKEYLRLSATIINN